MQLTAEHVKLADHLCRFNPQGAGRSILSGVSESVAEVFERPVERAKTAR